jgi:integrase
VIGGLSLHARLLGETPECTEAPSTAGIRPVSRSSPVRNLISRNAASLAKGPKVEAPQIDPLSAAEARLLMARVRGRREEALYTVALALGLRQGELLGLTWSNVDLGAGALHVRHALTRAAGQLILAEPKTARARRTLPLPPFVAETLSTQRTRQLEERLQAGSTWHDADLVFTTRLGRPLDGVAATRGFHRDLADAGLRQRRLYARKPAASARSVGRHGCVADQRGNRAIARPDSADKVARLRITRCLVSS